MQHLLRRRVDGVAAEVAQEVAVLLEHDDAHAAPGEQQAEHEAGGTAADDDAVGVEPAREIAHATSVLAPRSGRQGALGRDPHGAGRLRYSQSSYRSTLSRSVGRPPTSATGGRPSRACSACTAGTRHAPRVR